MCFKQWDNQGQLEKGALRISKHTPVFALSNQTAKTDPVSTETYWTLGYCSNMRILPAFQLQLWNPEYTACLLIRITLKHAWFSTPMRAYEESTQVQMPLRWLQLVTKPLTAVCYQPAHKKSCVHFTDGLRCKCYQGYHTISYPRQVGCPKNINHADNKMVKVTHPTHPDCVCDHCIT